MADAALGPGALAGSVIRTPTSGVRAALKNVPKPSTGLTLNRPQSGINFAAPPDRRTTPGTNGTH